MNCSEPDSLPIHRLAVYNPRRLSDSEVAAGFVARLPLLELLLRDLDGTPADAIPQHHLLVGQRGTGKTTLLRRLEAALREPPRAERFLPLSFPEEQYGVDRLSRFWLNCLDSLAEALEAAGRSEAVRVVDAAVGRLPAQFPGESRLAEEAAQVLLELGRRHGRRLVLLVDNLDLVLERLTAAEQHCLRAVLMRPAAPVVLGASVNPPRATTDYGAPFYDHFQTHFLNRLSLVEMQEVLRRLAQQTGRPEILSRLEAEHPRLQALYDLTGGNPRTTVLLFQLFAQGFSPEAYQDLEALLDWVTPLYKARFEELSDQAQVLVSALALAWSPVTSRRLGELTRLTNGQVSPELTRLQRAGFLEAVTVDPDERVGPIPDVGSPQDRTGYQLGERFFNIWFLMRHATRRDRRNLVFLTRFLESLYTAGERSTYARKLLSQRSLSRRERILGLALEPALEETALRHELRDHVHQEFLEAYRHLQERIDEILDPAEIPPHRYAFSELRDRLLAACPAGLEETPEEFADALLSSPALLLHREGLVTLQRNADQANALLEFAREDLALLPRRFDVDSVCWFTTLLRRGTLTSFDEPVQMSEIALRVETPGQARICTSFAGADALCGLTDPAFQSLSQHLAPAESSPAGLWYGWGFELDSRYRRYPAAEMAYREAIARAPQEFRPWNNLGVLLMNDSRRDAEAEQALREAIARAPQEWRPWNNLGILLTTHRRRYTEAEQAFCEAIARAPQASRPWINLGILLQEHLGRYAEAEAAYREALALNPRSVDPTICLASLLRDLLQRPDEAQELLKASPLPAEPQEEAALLLQLALTAAYAENWGDAAVHLQESLGRLGEEGRFPMGTHEAWIWAGAVLVHLGYGEKLLELLRTLEEDQRRRPWYEALRAMLRGDRRYLRNIPAEMQEAAGTLYDRIDQYRARLPAATRRWSPPEGKRTSRRSPVGAARR